jgi:hypothetical protein
MRRNSKSPVDPRFVDRFGCHRLQTGGTTGLRLMAPALMAAEPSTTTAGA